MTGQELQKMRKLDDIAEKAGGFVSPISASDVKYNYREILKYCRERKIEPQDLTIRELNKFIVE